LLKFEKIVPIFLVASLGVVSWILVVWSATNMDHPLVMLTMPISVRWNWVIAAAVFGMWSIMMAAMMLPAALPVLGAYQRMTAGGAMGATADGVVYFAAGHLMVWIGFAAAATLAQWVLLGSDAIEPMMIELRSPVAAGLVLAAAGTFQWTPLKNACLSRCRAPLGFLLTEWRPGRAGALVMGLRYGLFCVGCCWALMALIFVFGAMNLLAIITLTGLVVLEKTVPGGDQFARAIGIGLIGLGFWWIASA
jgi:predicted metal-binding membrane protein